MSKVSLSEELETPETPSETALEPAQRETALAAPLRPAGGSGLVGEIDDSDLKWPTINLVQAVGPLSESFPNQGGAIVYNKQTVLSQSPQPGQTSQPVGLTVLNARKYFEEWLHFDDERIPQTADTLERVRELNGTIRWSGDSRPSWRPVLEVSCLVEGPADTPGLDAEYDGRYFGRALWTLRSTAYKRAGTVIITAAQMSLRSGLVNGKFELCSKREKAGKNFIFVPILRQVGLHDPEFVEFAKGITGN